MAPESTVGPVGCRASIINSLSAFCSHRNDIATAAVQSEHGLCEALTDMLWSDAPKNHANTLRLMRVLTMIEEIPPEKPPDPEAPPPPDWRLEAHKRVKDCMVVARCVQIIKTDDLDAVAGAARMVQVLGRGPDEKGLEECKRAFKEAGAMEALVKVTRGHEDHFFDDQARKQSSLALEVLDVDGPMIERETIRQELIETQSTLCETITHLARGGSFRVRLEAAAWVRQFVFSHGSQSQDTALGEGIVPLLCDCLVDYGPGSDQPPEKQNDALDGFGSLLMILLRPELPKDSSRFAFGEADAHFEKGDFFEASLSYTAAIHARHPDVRLCFLRRADCYSAMGRPEDAASDIKVAADEWVKFCRQTEETVRWLFSAFHSQIPWIYTLKMGFM